MNIRVTGAALGAAMSLLLATAGVVGAFDQGVIPFTSGNPLTNGCPSGFEALAVGDLTPYGYELPSFLDDPANGGNGDGTVCGKPLAPQEQAARFPNAHVPIIFDFRDNNLPPFGR